MRTRVARRPAGRRQAAKGVVLAPSLVGGASDAAPSPGPAAVREDQVSGAPLPSAVRSFFEPRFRRDLGEVRIFHGPSAASFASSLSARAVTYGEKIFFGPGEYSPDTAHGRRLIAHELAHIQQPGAAGRISRKSLTDIPPPVRTRLRVSTYAINQTTMDDWMKELFDPKGGIKTSMTGVVMKFGDEITDAGLRDALGGVAASLVALSIAEPATKGAPARNADPAGWPLPEGTILDHAFDLRPLGGEHAIFRFIHYADKGSSRILIEKRHVLDKAAPPARDVKPAKSAKPGTPAAKAGGAAAPPAPAAAPAASVPANLPVVISAFDGDQTRAIVAAVALLPDSVRARIAGVKIVAASGPAPPDEQGHYDVATDTVRLWKDIFVGSNLRFGNVQRPTYGILHELAHVADARPQLEAKRAVAKARDKRALLGGRATVDPNAPIRRDKDVAEDERLRRKALAILDSEIEALEAAEDKTTALSGHRVDRDTEALTTDFGKALAADGVRPVRDEMLRRREERGTPRRDALTSGITRYAARDLAEAYAENFSYYLLDEPLLRAIRPNTHAYFVKSLPKPAAKP